MMIIQVLISIGVMAVIAPAAFDTALKFNIVSGERKTQLRTHLRMKELEAALMDPTTCLANLGSADIQNGLTVPNFAYTTGGVVDPNKLIIASRYLDRSRTEMNSNYNGYLVDYMELRPIDPLAFAGSTPGDPVLMYLEIGTLENRIRSVRRMPIYIEYDASQRVAKCSAGKPENKC